MSARLDTKELKKIVLEVRKDFQSGKINQKS
jgi:hypothetical protein